MPAIVPKSFAQMQADYHALLDHLAREWWKKQCADNYAVLYLIGRKGRDTHNCAIWERVRVGTAPHEGEELIASRPIFRGGTIDRARHEIREVLGREPLYVFTD
jgi:hypothetical protein